MTTRRLITPWSQDSLWDQPADEPPTSKVATRAAKKATPAPQADSFRARQALLLPKTVTLAGLRPQSEKGPELIVLLDEDGVIYMPAERTYSAGDILERGKDAGRIRKPIAILGSRWVCDMGGGALPWSEVKAKTPEQERGEYSPIRLREVIPERGYLGPVISPAEWFAEVDDLKRERSSLRGLRVRHGQTVYVCSDAELWVGYRQTVAEVGAPVEPAKPNLEIETTDQNHEFIREIQFSSIPRTYVHDASIERLFTHDNALWIYRGSAFYSIPSRNEGGPDERFFCDEVVPLSSWQGPTRRGNQHIRGDTPQSHSRRGVLLRCETDKRQYVMTGRTLTISRRKSAT